MTLEEQIGQVLAIGFFEPMPTQETIDLIQKYHVGNIILFKRNIQNVQQVRELTQYLQRLAREAGHQQPLLVMIDQENGMVRRFGEHTTIFPGNMALGAIGSEQVAYEVALATGRELQALGINMNLAPDVDVNNNPANPVIGVRSFGEDPRLVARLGVAMVKGYHDAGVVTTLKHFPGHGDTAVDSHRSLPTLPYAVERLDSLELIPFKHAIEAGAETIMTAHLYLPLLMRDEMLPATISREVITHLLRERLHFPGVIISDCMEMRAVSDTVGVDQGTVKALQAGVDLVLVSHHADLQRRSIEALYAALRNGTLSEERVQDAAGRVVHLKARTLSWNAPSQDSLALIGNEAHRRLRDDAYARSTTLVRDNNALLPLRLHPEQRLLLLFLQPAIFSGAVDAEFSCDALIEAIQQRHASVDTLVLTEQTLQADASNLWRAVDRADLIIVVTANANQDAYQAQIVQQLLHMKKAVIGIAAYNPYDLLAFPELGTYLATYEYTPPAFAAVARVLFGEAQPQGKLPVSIPGL
jgi:beta-N-acetylhexosaminidase